MWNAKHRTGYWHWPVYPILAKPAGSGAQVWVWPVMNHPGGYLDGSGTEPTRYCSPIPDCWWVTPTFYWHQFCLYSLCFSSSLRITVKYGNRLLPFILRLCVYVYNSVSIGIYFCGFLCLWIILFDLLVGLLFRDYCSGIMVWGL
jgi:hypothetical protein